MIKKKKIAFVLGIRPDLIRAVLIMRELRKAKDIDTKLIWSGQNYSHNLKGIFFEEFNVPKADVELDARGESDAEIVSKLISKLSPVLEKMKLDGVIFLGDTNTTAGCIAAAQLNIPIIHIEGCWHSYDWRMPEEKYRTMIDHLSDVIYTYEEEYKERGIAEGLNPKNIVVTKNPIVDILNEFYFNQKEKLDKIADDKFFRDRKIRDRNYYLMTCHRRENVHIKKSFDAILNLVSKAPVPVYFVASYRTQKIIKENKIKLPENLIITDPVGYNEILILLTHSLGVLTDSGTLNEEACVLGIPCINMRKSTERPQVYDVKASVKFDPDEPSKYTPEIIYKKLEYISKHPWKQNLGDGKASERIARDIIKRLRNNNIGGFLPKNNHLPIERSFMEDGIKI